jgi:OmcA/MtrC family decaheme c-type cytochrome
MANGYYTVVQALNANQVAAMLDAGGSGLLVVRGALQDAGDTLYFPNVTAAFAITDAQPVARRNPVLAEDGCRNCHMGLTNHGAGTGYNDNIQTCAVCHNSNWYHEGTSGGGRSWWQVGMQRNQGLMSTIHGVHNLSGFFPQAYANGKPQLRFPAMAPGASGDRRLKNCLQCHVDGSFELPLSAAVRRSERRRAGRHRRRRRAPEADAGRRRLCLVPCRLQQGRPRDRHQHGRGMEPLQDHGRRDVDRLELGDARHERRSLRALPWSRQGLRPPHGTRPVGDASPVA